MRVCVCMSACTCVYPRVYVCMHACTRWTPRTKEKDEEAERVLHQRREAMQDVACTIVGMLPTAKLTSLDPSRRSALHHAAASSQSRTCIAILDRLEVGQREGLAERPGDQGVVGEGEGEGEGMGEDLARKLVMQRAADDATVLHQAAARGMVLAGVGARSAGEGREQSVVHRLLDCGGKTLACMATRDGRTALHWAAAAGHEEVCGALLEVGGAELVMKQAKDGSSALAWAAGSGLCVAARGMLRLAGEAPALGGRRGTAVEELLKMRDKRDAATALHRAAWRAGCKAASGTCRYSPAEVEELCVHMVEQVRAQERESVVSALDGQRRNVLHIAAASGLAHLCRLLLPLARANRASTLLLQQDVDGRTPLHLAAALARGAGGAAMEAVCRDMIDIGGSALLMVTMANGRTALHVAAERGLGALCVAMVECAGRALLLVQGNDTRTAYNIADTLLPDSHDGPTAKNVLLALEEDLK